MVKKINKSQIAIIVLSSLLAISLIVGVVVAWFGNRDDHDKSFTMAGAINLSIGDSVTNQTDGLTINLPASANGLLPGMVVDPDITVTLNQSNTAALLRARFITMVEYPDNYYDPEFADITKYSNTTGFEEGKVLTDYNVYGGPITYTYYDSLGVETAVNKTLKRVEVRDSIVNAIGSQIGTTIAGINNVVVTSQNAAAMEVRQRGYDLTKVLNKLLSGEAGYKLNDNNELVADTSGVVESRKIADGWAFRELDQAWYFLGSNSNAFLLNDLGNVDTSRPMAKNIESYSRILVDGKIEEIPNYQVVSNADSLANNYLGVVDQTTGAIDSISNEMSVLSQDQIASIDLNQGDVKIDFLTADFELPLFIDNRYTNAEVTFKFEVEAVQDYLIDPLQQSTSPHRVPNNLNNAILLFNDAFKVADLSQTITSMGVYNNVLPAGFNDVSYNVSTGAYSVSGGVLSAEQIASTNITGFSILNIGSGYGLNYSEIASWQPGSVSSVGVNPKADL